MGSLHIAIGGGSAFLGLLAVSRAVGGSIGAAVMFLAIVVATLTIALGAAIGVTNWQERRAGELACSSCQREMTQLGDYRVCANCDQIVVGG